MNFPEYPPDAILTPEEVSAALRLDRRTIVRLASEPGGRRFGRRWRFRWGSVMEVFYANANQGERECLACQGDNQRGGGGQQDFPSGAPEGAGMDGGSAMGNQEKRGNFKRPKVEGKDDFGLRAALGVE